MQDDPDYRHHPGNERSRQQSHPSGVVPQRRYCDYPSGYTCSDDRAEYYAYSLGESHKSGVDKADHHDAGSSR